MIDYPLLCLAGFAAGVINAIAGGGTFLTFPALVWAGVPPVAANATSAVAVFPGYVSSVLGFRRDLRGLPAGVLLRAALWSLAGGLIGGTLLLVSSDRAFSVVIPFLLLFATLAFAFQNRIVGRVRARARPVAANGAVGLLGVSVCGGYFNGGLGIVMLALFALWGMRDLGLMNGLKNALSAIVSAISVAVFILAGIVAWPQALAMAAANVAGGYAGARLARVLPATVVRAVIVGVGLTMSVIFLARLVYDPTP